MDWVLESDEIQKFYNMLQGNDDTQHCRKDVVHERLIDL